MSSIDHASPQNLERLLELEALLDQYKQREAEQAKLLATEQEQRRLAEMLYQTSTALSSTLNYEVILDRILEQVRQAIPHDAASIMLVEEGVARIFRRRGYARFGTDDHSTGLVLTIADTPTLRFMQETGRPLAILSVEEDQTWVEKPEAAWIKSYLGAPLFLQNRLIGFLNLNSATPKHFKPEDLDRLQAFTSQAAMALKNARLFDQSRQENIERVRALKRERDFISAVLDTAGALVMVLNRQGRIIRFNRACEQTTGYTFEEVRGHYWWDLFLPLEEIAPVKAEFETLRLDQPHKRYESEWLTRDGRRRVLAWSNTVLYDPQGTIEYILNTGIDLTERKEAEEALKASNQQLQALTNRLQEELNLAQKIQQSLLPIGRPAWPGLDVVCRSVPAREVGGDFYAYHAFDKTEGGGRQPAEKEKKTEASPSALHLHPSSFAIAVGDVSGKGMPAALLMAASLTALQSIIGQAFNPSDLLAALDLALKPYTKTTLQNCALCYAEITPPTPEQPEGHLRVANAGCVTPLICRANGEVEWVEVGGLPLGVGLGDRLAYAEAHFSLKAGDLVIFTSDGLIEAVNAAGDLFSFERLEQAVATGPKLSAAAMLAHLWVEVTAFAGNTELRDDLTIVVVQV